MLCTHCGQAVPDGNKFCQHCGNPLTADTIPPLSRPPIATFGSRMQTHVKVLAWIHLIFGALGCVAALAIFMLFSFLGRRGPFSTIHHDPVFTSIGFLGLGMLLAGFCLVFSLPGVLAGYGLLNYRPWARILTLILCFLNLLNIPLGTILGIYGLWVLLSREGEQHYQEQAALSPGG